MKQIFIDNNFNLSKSLENYLERKNIFSLNTIQKKVIPLVLKGNNVFVESPTASGKTFAFLLPVLTKIDNDSTIQAIIFAPTTSLITQIISILKELKSFVKFTYINLIDSKEDHKEKIYNIIVTTPTQFIKKEKLIILENLKYFIFDEIDMMIKFDFFNKLLLNSIFLKNLERTNLLFFSASFPLELQNWIKNQIKNKSFKNIIDNNLNQKTTNYLIKSLNSQSKLNDLLALLNKNYFNPYICVIFANKNVEAKAIYDFLKKNNLKKIIDLYVSDLPFRTRKQIQKKLHNEKLEIIITTDSMSRGIDVQGISHIINFSLPIDFTFYKHRVGRTNRIDDKGKIYTFYLQEEEKYIKKLKLINKNISFKNLTL